MATQRDAEAAHTGSEETKEEAHDEAHDGVKYSGQVEVRRVDATGWRARGSITLNCPLAAGGCDALRRTVEALPEVLLVLCVGNGL